MKEICAGVNSSEDRREKKVTEWAKQLKTVREILKFSYIIVIIMMKRMIVYNSWEKLIEVTELLIYFFKLLNSN